MALRLWQLLVTWHQAGSREKGGLGQGLNSSPRRPPPSDLFPDTKSYFPQGSHSSQTEPPAEDQEFKHISPCREFHTQITAGRWTICFLRAKATFKKLFFENYKFLFFENYKFLISFVKILSKVLSESDVKM